MNAIPSVTPNPLRQSTLQYTLRRRGHFAVDLNRRAAEDAAMTATDKSSTDIGPLQFGKILAPVDFSEKSRELLRFAVRFAKQHQARLLLLHVVEPISYPTYADYPSLTAVPISGETIDDAKAGLEKLRRVEVPPDMSVDIEVRSGRPHIEVTDAARKLQVDLIIISTHGRTGLSHILLGSTAEHVVRYAPCPVLTLRERA